MKREKLFLSACILGGAFILVLGWLSFTARVDQKAAAEYGEIQRDARSLHSERAAEILRIHSGMKSHFDLVVRKDAELRHIYSRLETPPSFVAPPNRRELARQARHLSELNDRTVTLIERFKSDSAILRNSLRYLTVVAAPPLQRNPKTEGAPPSSNALRRLIRAILLLQIEYSDDALKQTEAIVRETRTDEPELRLEATHSQIVVERTRSIAATLRDLSKVPTHSAAEKLLRSYERELSEARRRSVNLLEALFGVVLFTGVSGAAYIIERLRRSAASLRKSGIEMAEAMERQLELNDLKTSFVSMTSHEFRTPLSRIVSSSELISAYRSAWPEEKVEVHLGRIRESALTMTKMLDDILLIGRSESGMLKFEPKPMSISALCAEVVSTVEQGTSAAGRIHVEKIGEDDALADESLLRHVLENLLTNAVKYSEKSVVLRADVTRDGIEFVVKDEGIGICEEDLDHLFDTFHRGKNVGKISGTGLGLAIVKRATDLHGGSLFVSSEVGRGTELRVVIPRGGINA